jgi:glycosyltransferase involved in cell wall biosynthesis
LSQYGGGLPGLGLRLLGGPLRMLDRQTAAGVDGFVANSQYVRQRIGRTYQRDARVVYPPVTAKPADRATARGQFLLCLGRLVPYKRTDIAIRAAEEAGLPLVIAGDGPERERLELMAGPSTTFLGSVTEEQAGTLLEECAAMLFCGEEDFGIVGAEANLHGAPVICYGRGGMVEIVGEDGAGGVTFDRQTVECAREAITTAMGRQWDDARLRTNGARFSPTRFRAGIRDAVRWLLDTPAAA